MEEFNTGDGKPLHVQTACHEAVDWKCQQGAQEEMNENTTLSCLTFTSRRAHISVREAWQGKPEYRLRRSTTIIEAFKACTYCVQVDMSSGSGTRQISRDTGLF
jgi:hypothetical protein